MAKLARLPTFDTAAAREPADGQLPRLRTRYYAFLSYSHKDKELADWLHRELEKFRVPHALAGKLTANGVVPRRLTPIFRDQHDLSAGGELAVEIEGALAASQFLVVLCSPTAAKSHWTNLEIESFKRTRPEGCVLAAVAEGEPFASDIPGREDEECFPPALRYKYDRRGRATAKRADPLAADFREAGEGKRLAFLKLVAGMLGIGLDELVQRETTRRQRRLAILAAASLGGMAVTSTLAFTAIQARDAARDQRREAEGLIGFMLGDLKDKLEPIGRLDALDGVGSRVLAYYQKEGTADLSDAALSQRSRALSLMAEVADARGDFDAASRFYREAMAGTSESIQRDPTDPERLFEHAQNVFYFGQMRRSLGDLEAAESAMREYKRLADRMVALAPDNMKWRMEVQYAEFDLGVLLKDQRRFSEAATQFRDSLTTIQAISTADPANRDYQGSIAESLSWLGDAFAALGRYDEAIAAYQRRIAVLDRLLAATRDVDYRQRLVPAHRSLGDLYVERGQRDLAIGEFRAAISHADALTALEPNNAQWLTYAMTARDHLARQLLTMGHGDEAGPLIDFVCSAADKLATRDPKKPDFRRGLANCLLLRARLALATGAKAQALDLATRAAIIARSVHTTDPTGDAYFVAAAYRRIGDIQQALGNAAGARSAWTEALGAMPAKAAEQPAETALHVAILRRLGRQAEAAPLVTNLAQMGYRDPEFRAM
jgi:eukaryotic-like serine/threonine-protein kinase